MNRDQATQKNTFQTDSNDSRLHFITTKALTPSELPASLANASTTQKQLGIGQRAILIETSKGNVLWDLIAFIDQPTIDFINSKGGLKAIVISHPHFYTTHLEWARIFKCPVYLAQDDSEWLNREDKHGVRKWIKGVEDIKEVDGEVKAIQCGGHFEGSMVLLWEKKLFIADTMMSVPVSIMKFLRYASQLTLLVWILPQGSPTWNNQLLLPVVICKLYVLNLLYLLHKLSADAVALAVIPLPPAKIHGIWTAIKPFDFDTTYGGFIGQDVTRPGLKKEVLESMKIFCRIGGHEIAGIYQETL